MKITSFRDIYSFPFFDAYVDEDGWRSKKVYDRNNNFIFEFKHVTDNAQINMLEIINGEKESESDLLYFHREGTIWARGDMAETRVIDIRGWGNLTGTGGYNLSEESAMIVQDTLAEYIIQRLNKS